MQGSPGEVLTWGPGDEFQLKGIQPGCVLFIFPSSPLQGAHGCRAILLGHNGQHCRFNPRPPLSPKTCNLSRRWDESACRWLCGVDVAHGGRGAAWTGREPFPGPSTCQDSRDRGWVLVLSLRANDTERKGEEGRAALGDPQELQREDPEGLGRELGAPTLGVRRCVLLAGVQPDPLPGWLFGESGLFFLEAVLQRAKGFLCFLLSSGGILPLPANLLVSLPSR